MKKEKEYKWLIIEGCPRSGTTITKEVLNAHQKIALTHEISLIKLISKKKRLDKIVSEYRKIFKNSKDLSQVVYFGDKLPKYYRKNPIKLKSILPNLKIIHISRNPYFTINSIIKRTKEAKIGKDKTWNPYLSVYDGCNFWISAWNYIARINSQSNVLHLKYEDLIKTPKEELNKIGNFLNLKSDFDYKRIIKPKTKMVLSRKQKIIINDYLSQVITNWNKPLERLINQFPKIKNIPFSKLRRSFKGLLGITFKKIISNHKD